MLLLSQWLCFCFPSGYVATFPVAMLLLSQWLCCYLPGTSRRRHSQGSDHHLLWLSLPLISVWKRGEWSTSRIHLNINTHVWNVMDVWIIYLICRKYMKTNAQMWLVGLHGGTAILHIGNIDALQPSSPGQYRLSPSLPCVPCCLMYDWLYVCVLIHYVLASYYLTIIFRDICI